MEDISKKIKSLSLRQGAIKILINSIYGAFGNKWFYFYNIDIAQSITLQGQNLIKFSIKAINFYFKERWHQDHELHKIMGIDGRKISKISEDAAIYTDTDSCSGDTSINIKTLGSSENPGHIKNMTIEDWYNNNIKNGNAGVTLSGHESVKTSDMVLNWSKDKQLYYAPVKRIIRHKVSKERWRLTTKSGKKIIVTGDHSLIVFRNNKQIEIKARNINIKTDKVLVVK